MSTDRRWAGRAFVVVGLVSTLFAACARGNETETTSTTNGTGGTTPSTSSQGGSGGAGTGGLPSTGEVGSPCVAYSDCNVGVCTQVGDKKYCTVACPPDCPMGTYCSIVNGDSLCIPDLGQQCDICTSIADCAMPTDRCFKAPLGDTFCARDCTTLGLCPNGFTCMDGDAYVGGSGSGGGAMDAGVSDAGSDGGDAGNDAGDAGMSKPTQATKWCVPNSGFSCPCNDQRDGVSRDCTNATPSGTCSGQESCDGKAGKWAGCTASTPKPESCNGKDDNCDSKIDDGDPNMLCASSGAPPPNSNWSCTAGTCALGACQPGWTAYPPGPLTNGCQCPVEVGEPNGGCGTAKDAGMVSDAGGSVLMQGTLSADNDVDFWTFTTVDTNEMTTNSYHVSVDFTAPAANTEFLIDVMRGAGTCSDVPTGVSSALVSYDWCVDGTGPAGGELVCGELDNVTHCNDNSAVYFVRVYRKPGAVASCTPYTVTATAKGGGPCDFTAQCP